MLEVNIEKAFEETTNLYYSFKYETQIYLNKLVRKQEFKSYVMQYVDTIPSGFVIVIYMSGNKYCFDTDIRHYGYESASNNGISMFSDLSDFYTLPNDPPVSEELANAAFGYLKEFEPQLWNLSLIDDYKK